MPRPTQRSDGPRLPADEGPADSPSLLKRHALHPFRLGAEIAFDLSLAVALAASDAMLRLAIPSTPSARKAAARTASRGEHQTWQPPKQARPGREQPTVTADDGVELHVEVDGDPQAAVTVVLCHGYALNLDSWGFQRAALGKDARLVAWDHRGHGQSGAAHGEHASLAQLGRDLHAVLEQAVPEGPVVLVGHSMGGMAILALADQHPELFGDRVVGVGLLATAAGSISGTLGFPRYVADAVQIAVPGVLSALRQERPLSRWAAQDLAQLLTRRYAFASEVPAALMDYLADMIRSTPIETLADFFPHFRTHDNTAALPVLRRVETLIMVGDGDLLTPVEDSRAIAAEVPDAELVVAADAGHAVLLERPRLVTAHLRALLDRARKGRSR